MRYFILVEYNSTIGYFNQYDLKSGINYFVASKLVNHQTHPSNIINPTNIVNAKVCEDVCRKGYLC